MSPVVDDFVALQASFQQQMRTSNGEPSHSAKVDISRTIIGNNRNDLFSSNCDRGNIPDTIEPPSSMTNEAETVTKSSASVTVKTQERQYVGSVQNGENRSTIVAEKIDDTIDILSATQSPLIDAASSFKDMPIPTANDPLKVDSAEKIETIPEKQLDEPKIKVPAVQSTIPIDATGRSESSEQVTVEQLLSVVKGLPEQLIGPLTVALQGISPKVIAETPSIPTSQEIADESSKNLEIDENSDLIEAASANQSISGESDSPKTVTIDRSSFINNDEIDGTQEIVKKTENDEPTDSTVRTVVSPKISNTNAIHADNVRKPEINSATREAEPITLDAESPCENIHRNSHQVTKDEISLVIPNPEPATDPPGTRPPPNLVENPTGPEAPPSRLNLRSLRNKFSNMMAKLPLTKASIISLKPGHPNTSQQNLIAQSSPDASGSREPEVIPKRKNENGREIPGTIESAIKKSYQDPRVPVPVENTNNRVTRSINAEASPVLVSSIAQPLPNTVPSENVLLIPNVALLPNEQTTLSTEQSNSKITETSLLIVNPVVTKNQPENLVTTVPKISSIFFQTNGTNVLPSVTKRSEIYFETSAPQVKVESLAETIVPATKTFDRNEINEKINNPDSSNSTGNPKKFDPDIKIETLTIVAKEKSENQEKVRNNFQKLNFDRYSDAIESISTVNVGTLSQKIVPTEKVSNEKKIDEFIKVNSNDFSENSNQNNPQLNTEISPKKIVPVIVTDLVNNNLGIEETVTSNYPEKIVADLSPEEKTLRIVQSDNEIVSEPENVISTCTKVNECEPNVALDNPTLSSPSTATSLAHTFEFKVTGSPAVAVKDCPPSCSEESFERKYELGSKEISKSFAIDKMLKAQKPLPKSTCPVKSRPRSPIKRSFAKRVPMRLIKKSVPVSRKVAVLYGSVPKNTTITKAKEVADQMARNSSKVKPILEENTSVVPEPKSLPAKRHEIAEAPKDLNETSKATKANNDRSSMKNQRETMTLKTKPDVTGGKTQATCEKKATSIPTKIVREKDSSCVKSQCKETVKKASPVELSCKSRIASKIPIFKGTAKVPAQNVSVSSQKYINVRVSEPTKAPRSILQMPKRISPPKKPTATPLAVRQIIIHENVNGIEKVQTLGIKIKDDRSVDGASLSRNDVAENPKSPEPKAVSSSMATKKTVDEIPESKNGERAASEEPEVVHDSQDESEDSVYSEAEENLPADSIEDDESEASESHNERSQVSEDLSRNSDLSESSNELDSNDEITDAELLLQRTLDGIKSVLSDSESEENDRIDNGSDDEENSEDSEEYSKSDEADDFSNGESEIDEEQEEDEDEMRQEENEEKEVEDEEEERSEETESVELPSVIEILITDRVEKSKEAQTIPESKTEEAEISSEMKEEEKSSDIPESSKRNENAKQSPRVETAKTKIGQKSKVGKSIKSLRISEPEVIVEKKIPTKRFSIVASYVQQFEAEIPRVEKQNSIKIPEVKPDNSPKNEREVSNNG